jgi:CubicO group peptidase (beta-lactamase class C family)
MNTREIKHPHTAAMPACLCELSRRELRCAAGLLVTSVLMAIPAQAAQTAIEQRIERIRSALLPPVLVQGEPIQASDLSSRMRELGVPGVSIAVIHDGRIEWARGFGFVAAHGAAITPETLFQTGSIGKPITTVAALRLVQAGKLTLDTDVNQYLESWKLPSNEFTQQAPVTLRGLLTHSAGVTVEGFRGYESGSPLPTPIQILDGEPPANNPPIRVDMTPGQMWRYSGGGFQIAQQMMTDVTGTPFDILMQEWVLRPLGMHHSTYAQPLPAKLLAQAALAHREDGTVLAGGANVFPLDSGATITFWREGARFKARIWAQPVVELFSSSRTEYFAKVVDARVVFPLDMDGREAEAALLQSGRVQPLRRLHGKEAREELEASRAAENRFKAQVVAPGSENALRQIITGIASGPASV